MNLFNTDIREFGLRGLGEVAFGNLAVAGLAAFTGVLLARGLDPTGRGELALAMTIAGLTAAVAANGVRPALVYFVAREEAGQRAPWITASRTLAVYSTAVAVAVAVVALLVLDAESRFAATLGIAFVSMPLVIFGGIPSAIAQVDSIGLWNGLRILGPFGYFGSVAFLWITDSITPVSAAASFALGTAAATVVSFKAVGQSREAPWWSRDWGKQRALLGYGGRATISTLSKTVSARLDVIALGVVASVADVGVYAVALGAASLLSPLGSVFAPSLTPRVAGAKDRAEQRRLTMTAVVWGSVGTTLSGAIAFLVAPSALPVLLGPGWTEATTPFRVLLFAVVFRSVSQTLGASLSGAGKPGRTSVAESVSTGVTVVAVGPMVGAFGPAGAAGTAVLAATASCITLGFSCRRAYAPVRKESPDDLVLTSHQCDSR